MQQEKSLAYNKIALIKLLGNHQYSQMDTGRLCQLNLSHVSYYS